MALFVKHCIDFKFHELMILFSRQDSQVAGAASRSHRLRHRHTTMENDKQHWWPTSGFQRGCVCVCGGGDAFSAQSSGCVPTVWNADKRAAELLSSLALARVQVESLEVQAGWGASRGPAKKKSTVDVRLRMITVSHLDTVSTTDPLCPITLMLGFAIDSWLTLSNAAAALFHTFTRRPCLRS